MGGRAGGRGRPRGPGLPEVITSAIFENRRGNYLGDFPFNKKENRRGNSEVITSAIFEITSAIFLLIKRKIAEVISKIAEVIFRNYLGDFPFNKKENRRGNFSKLPRRFSF